MSENHTCGMNDTPARGPAPTEGRLDDAARERLRVVIEKVEACAACQQSDVNRERMAMRSNTPEKKRATLDRLLAKWLERPDLRLGQLVCALVAEATGGTDPFYVEDARLLCPDHGDAVSVRVAPGETVPHYVCAACRGRMVR